MVLEGNLVNLDVTSPAATLALALMFLKTNDAGVAASFVIPDTHFALDYVRPNFILLRVLARALVMWDKLLPTEAWVQQQLPRLLRVSLSMRLVVHRLRARKHAHPEALFAGRYWLQGWFPCLTNITPADARHAYS